MILYINMYVDTHISRIKLNEALSPLSNLQTNFFSKPDCQDNVPTYKTAVVNPRQQIPQGPPVAKSALPSKIPQLRM